MVTEKSQEDESKSAQLLFTFNVIMDFETGVT